MFSWYHRTTYMHPSSTQRGDCHDIWNNQYGCPHVVFADVYVESLTTTGIASIIEFAILVFSLVGIRRASRHRESHLAWLLKTQGIIYFVMVFLLHLAMIVSAPVLLKLTFADIHAQRS